MTTPLTITSDRRADGTQRLAVSGEIDMSNGYRLAEALAAMSGRLLLDLTAVEYIDSAGLNVLFAHADRLEVLVAPRLSRVLTVSGLTELATVRPVTST
ncbi:STAS domain-containing protein [Actinacidiphila acidipaludis]|uniref:STAS domain-containing protein n=1 Tax=Actinacidiphila acidipaludis TaxID=2873382 RepID=A0ABS7QDQ0_9ACTN|nr:STAS domain-containing protein [Streptomyces acidipaludis]MBY8880082.1 STAS domain-containing protein [Streptomyces acidipaludis]